jgi:hypothetical protein
MSQRQGRDVEFAPARYMSWLRLPEMGTLHVTAALHVTSGSRAVRTGAPLRMRHPRQSKNAHLL